MAAKTLGDPMNILMPSPDLARNDAIDRLDSLKASLELALSVLTTTPQTLPGLGRGVVTAIAILAEAARADDAPSFSLH